MNSSSGSASLSKPPDVYSIRVPKSVNKKYHIMRFNGNLGVDLSKWRQVKMERENNLKEFKSIEEDQPKFGAGSEFGREAKEEARRKKLGIAARKYKPDDQPWILKAYGNGVKKFKGFREGGVGDNSSYYVFTHAENQVIEAFPLQEWYKFQPIQRYKTLSAEEAEEEFSRRDKHLNFFSLMMKKRLKGDDEGEAEEVEEKAKKGSKKSQELKISEIDDWIDSSDGDSSDEENKEEKEEGDDDKKKQKQKKGAKPKKKKRDTDKEAFEDSDDGDEEGRELDYISDSSDSEPENVNLESVAEEKGLRKILNSEDESENESDKSDNEENDENEENKDKDGEKAEAGDKEKKKKKKQKKDVKEEVKKDKESNSDFSSDSSSEDESNKKKPDKKNKKEDKQYSSANSSRCTTPTEDNKRKIINDALAGPSAKKLKLDPLSSHIPGLSESGITEDAVRKYLMRKPMTTTELLQKFKSKKTGINSEQLVNVMTSILKKINPVRQTTKGKMYLSIKS